MDDIVLRGMGKWPNVPAVYGWLSLDRRGNWRIKGERISNPNVTAFISRNYDHDDEGRWFFQNGPQRVFVTLEYTPFVYRIGGDNASPAIECHTMKRVARVRGAWLDEAGTLLLQTEHGIGIVNDLDSEVLLQRLVDAQGQPVDDDTIARLTERLQRQERASLWLALRGAPVRIEPINSADVPRCFGYVARPAEAGSPR